VNQRIILRSTLQVNVMKNRFQSLAMRGAAALALAAVFYVAPAGAIGVLCKDDLKNHMSLDSAFVSSCIDAGLGNIGNGKNDDFLNGGSASGWTDITSLASFLSKTQNGSTGTFSFDPTLWDDFGSIALGFKFGTGNQPDEWFVYLLNDLVSSGSWTFFNVFGTGGGLSHLTLYGGEGECCVNVPEPNTLTLFGVALSALALALRYRRRTFGSSH
jgi:PEP-CTERM motif